MSSIEKMGAMESMFDPEQTTAKLLEAVKANVAETVKTVDAAATLENKLSEEAAQFNACLTTMSNAIRKCERGEISREEMLAECAPCVAALKEKCVALKLADVKATGDDITEDEIAMLREYIVGCKDIVADRKQELQDCPVEGASEGLLAGLANVEPAVEAANQATEIRKSTEAKTANELYKQAKKLYGLGSKEKALEYLKKAQKLYEKCLEKAEKAAKMVDVERTVKGYNVEDKFNKKLTDNVSMAYVIDYFEDRIDSCKALEMQWNNKAGKSTYAETKKQLKAERKQIKHENRLNAAKDRAGKKAEFKAKHDAKKYADAAYKAKMDAAETGEEREAVESMFDVMYATEAFADELLMDFDLASAMESEGAEGEAPAVSENEQKLRDLYTEFNEAKAAGDEDKMNQLVGEIQKVLDAVNKEAQDAYTEDDLKAADRKLAKGLAIGAAVVAAAAAVGVGVKTGAFANVANAALKQADKLKSKKGENKSETGKAKGLMNNLKTALGGLKGKIAVAKANRMQKQGKPLPLPAPEAMIDGMTIEEFDASMESLMDSMEFDLAMEAAMEAEGEGEEGAAKSASGIGAKFRAAFAKLKKGKKDGDQAAINEGREEIREAAEELEEAEQAAETPEEKKKLSKAAKIGLAAGAAAAATIGITAGLAVRAKKMAESGAEVKGANKTLVSLYDTVAKAAQNVGDAAASRRVGKEEQRQAKSASDKERADRYLINKVEGERQKKIDAMNKAGNKYEKKKAKGSLDSVLTAMAFGLEGVMVEDEDVDDDYIEPAEGKAFDDEDLIETATEAAIAVMMAEDGIDDSDLI